MNTQDTPLYCCEKMYEVLFYDNATLRLAKPNLISLYLGDGEIVQSKESQAMKKVAMESVLKKANKDKKNRSQVWKINKDQLKSQEFEDKVIKYSITEMINFCPFCGESFISE